MRFLAITGLALLLAGCATASPDEERRTRILGKPEANPSAVVAAELAFARLAREKGQWTAFRETATDDAVMFVPNLQNAQQWLKGKADPPQAVEWQPHKIIISCDGSLAVSVGAWQGPDGSHGLFNTIWQQQDFGKRRSDKPVEWKWVFDHGQPLDKALAEPDFVETEKASCDGKAPAIVSGLGTKFGSSRDRTLHWTADQRSGTRTLSINLWKNGKFEQVLRQDFGTGTPE